MAQNEYDLEGVLEKCRKAASDGYKIASEHTAYIKDTLQDAEKEVQATLDDFKKSQVYDSGVTDKLCGQLEEIKSRFGMLSDAFNDDLESIEQNISKFSITLFGRTMAGKSTLMEVLTHGDGRTIGKGAQRTTRDVRTYEWNGLQITDVPGIGAFNGEEDENIAFEAAQSADLILFLLTDDGPQSGEAECLERIASLGKPVIFIMNVKSAIDDDMELALYDLEDRFNMQRLDKIKNEFLDYVDKQGQEWKNYRFVYVHLLAAFVAQNRKQDKTAATLYRASRIAYLKKQIITRIQEKGEFYSKKTFIDCIVNSVLESEEILLEQFKSTSTQGRIVLAKRRNLEEWKEKFKEDGEQRIDSALIEIRSRLNSKIFSFAQEHYADSHAAGEWKKEIDRLNLPQTCQKVLENLEEQANDKIRETVREIGSELKFIVDINEDSSLNMPGISNGRKYWNRGLIVLGGAISIAGLLPFLAVAGAFAFLGFLGTWLFDSMTDKTLSAIENLQHKLDRNADDICEKLKSQMLKSFRKIVKNKITALIQELYRMDNAVFRLADTQKALAWKLNGRLLDLNKKIVTEAFRLTGATGLEWWIEEVARIPNKIVMLRLADGRKLPDEKMKKLRKLVYPESVRIVFYTENKKWFLSRIMGNSIERYQISIEEKIGVAHVPYNDSDTDMRNRARLAQQLTRLVITK